jgi:hypothetical protein
MKHLFSLLAACLVASAAWAQTTVTLTVDMSNETVSADGVHVAGNFQGWDPSATPMTDNGDGTYSHTFTSDTAATYHYKFINGNAWGSDESVPAACAFDGNRQVVVDGMMGSVETLACYTSCAACGQSTVRFRVDMSNETVSPFGVHVAGTFQGWDPGATELTDPDGDMVYETIQAVDVDSTGQIVFKFINGNSWSDMNELIDPACGDSTGNRVLELDSLAVNNILLSADEIGSPYCFNSCSSCVLPLSVTFTVDMSVVASVSENGVHLAGSFQGWNPGGTPMTDNGDGTWSVTAEMAPGTYEFKFINSNAWDGNEENMEGSGCNNGSNRLATFDADNNTYNACFNTCPGESCTPDPDPANITFRVNMSEQTLTADDTVFVWGGFTGWQGGALAMTDADEDGIWEQTALISGSANVDYKYSIGHPSGASYVEEDGVYVLDGDTTNFVASGCGVDNGFGGYNRRHVRSGSDEILAVVCFNKCEDCEGSSASVNDWAMNFEVFPNPTTGLVTLAGVRGVATVEVLDAQGRVVMTQPQTVFGGADVLSLAHLRSGAYQVVITQGAARGVRRVMVQ